MNHDVRFPTAVIHKPLAILLASLALCMSATKLQAVDPPLASGDAVVLQAEADACKSQLLTICADEQYRFTPNVRDTYIAYAKLQSKADLAAQGKTVPDEFLAWIDANPEIEAAVYGARLKASNVLLMLYSLQLDLGTTDFEEYRQLALAAAIVHNELGPEADITPHEPIQLVIGGDPRQLIDTKEPGRALDQNDHIINFLNDNTLEEEVVVGYEEVLPELKYDDRGIAIPAPKAKPKKVPVTELQTRSLYAADVLASEALQEKFNAYMKSKGEPVEIHCGEQIIHWKSRDMVRGEELKRLNEAYLLFRGAYEAKGLLPAQRDPFPTPGERCAYLIRNDRYRFPAETQVERNWPRFPLTAPWPVLAMLVADNQPLREREERWIAFRDEGIFKTYGEYIGSIAQQHNMQSARRLTPHPYSYNTIQMMLKDGGVCGTMGNISARSHITLGLPACTAGQPGHCAVVGNRYDLKTDTYICKGSQYATGGDDKTTPHARWLFEQSPAPSTGKRGPRKPMIYHQTIAWAVNHGMSDYLNSTMAFRVFSLLPETDQKTDGLKLLGSGLTINRYNFLLVDTAQTTADTPEKQILFWLFFKKQLAKFDDQPGCPSDGLYNKTVKNRMFANIAKLPVPEDKKMVGHIYEFLQAEQCDLPAALITYRLALSDLPTLLSQVEQEYDEHLQLVQSRIASENDQACTNMAATVLATANCIKDRGAKKQWALTLWQMAQGREKYIGNKYRIATDPSVSTLAKLAGQKMPPENLLIQPVLDRAAAGLQQAIIGERDIKECRVLAAKLKAAIASIKDTEQKHQWLEVMSQIIAEQETFKQRGAKASAKSVRDPCADTISQAIKALQTE